MYYPGVQIVHHHSRGSYKNLKLLFVHIRSAVQYFNKWGWLADTQRNVINNKVMEAAQSATIKENTLKVKTA